MNAPLAISHDMSRRSGRDLCPGRHQVTGIPQLRTVDPVGELWCSRVVVICHELADITTTPLHETWSRWRPAGSFRERPFGRRWPLMTAGLCTRLSIVQAQLWAAEGRPADGGRSFGPAVSTGFPPSGGVARTTGGRASASPSCKWSGWSRRGSPTAKSGSGCSCPATPLTPTSAMSSSSWGCRPRWP